MPRVWYPVATDFDNLGKNMITKTIAGLEWRVVSPAHYILLGDWVDGQQKPTEWHICFYEGAWDLQGLQGENETAAYVLTPHRTRDDAAMAFTKLLEKPKELTL